MRLLRIGVDVRITLRIGSYDHLLRSSQSMTAREVHAKLVAELKFEGCSRRAGIGSNIKGEPRGLGWTSR
jgi:hypothetical protein